MKTLLMAALAILFALAPVAPAAAQDRPATFEAKERQEIIELLNTEIPDSQANAKWNRGYDIVFKVLLFIISGLAAIGAARVAALGEIVPPVWLKTSNLALTALAPLITSLAFTQFDFAKRQAVWERRHYALVACKMSIQFTSPGREAFLSSLDAILRWGDAYSLNELGASCVGKPLGTATPPSAAASPVAAAAPSAMPAPAVPPSQPRK